MTLTPRQQPDVSLLQRALVSGVAAIVVDAVVRDGKGKPVTDLGKQDFQIIEDGVQQDIGDVTGFAGPIQAVVEGAALPSAPAGAPARAARARPSFTAIVFNRLAPEPRGRAYQGALACLDTLQDGDFVAVFVTDLSLTTVQAYTNDRAKVRKALDDAVRRAAWSSPPALFPEDAPSSGSSVQTATVNNWNSLEKSSQVGYATTDALLAIVTGLGAAPGRRSVVFFSEGIPVADPVLSRLKTVIATANRGAVTIYAIDAIGLRTASQEADAGRAVRTAGAAGLTLDPAGANLNSLGTMEGMSEGLRTPSTVLTLLARDTGGFLVENTNNLANAFRQVDADRRFYYLLTYTPKKSTFTGEWRSITVKVPHRRVTIRARSGYLAVRPPSTLPPAGI